jgi:hypothetical protein
MKPIFLGLALVAVTACAAPDGESCEELRSAIAYDAPGPWHATPQELTRHVEGSRVGGLLWVIGGETTVSVTTTLDTNSATAIDRVFHEGDDGERLACSDSIEMTATLEIVTADGGLQELLTVELEATQGGEGGQAGWIDGWVDLSHHDFSGPLSWQPGDSNSEVFLRLRWLGDEPQTLRGWLVWGDSSEVEIKGNKIVGKGVNEVLAQFETTLF